MWGRSVEDSERDIRGSAPKEPSARARRVTERLRAMGEARARSNSVGKERGWGRNKPAAPPAGPEAWRTGPAWQGMDGRATRRRKGWSVVSVLVAAAVAVVAVNPSGASAAPPARETARRGSAPSAEPADMPTRERPFAGSPAARWESGAEIRLPAPLVSSAVREDAVRGGPGPTFRPDRDSSRRPAPGVPGAGRSPE
ncbi:hypothetical protein [Streptomyces sp. KMM 9044]|uniref:hypothetical protein n=1 Tax=Streptomyces sp. KMM 9044 TaxID=2744474 RepID=UPI00215163D8|nr:hypothetical protein [Streptomyces sp. KMM 9044]WAX78407.1 hypothetical protein HUV60_012680 [Streptomyces sp. KMM 9044]